MQTFGLYGLVEWEEQRHGGSFSGAAELLYEYVYVVRGYLI